MFDKICECLFPENCKKNIKNLHFGALPEVLFKSGLKKPFFGALKFKYLWNCLDKSKK